MSNGKKGKGGKPKAPEVPKEAPADVKEFVDCKGKSLNFKGGKQTWVPLPDAAKKLGATPEITFEPGEKAGSIQVTIGISYVSITLPASVTNGELSVDTSSLPDMFGFGDAKKGIKDWTDQLNAWLKANGWKLDPPTVKDGAATLAKSAIGAAAPGQAAKDGANAQEPKKEEPKKEEPKGTPGKIKAAAATGAFLLGIGGGSLFSPGPEAGGAEQPTDPVPVEKVAQQPGEQTVLALPKGPVQANMTATPEGGGNPVQLQGTFTQEGQMLILVLPALPPFTGTIDDQASFDVENDVGSFVGRFVKNEVMGKHIFDGNPYTLTGTLSDSVEETTTSDGEARPLVGYIEEDFDYSPMTLDGGGGFGWPFWFGLGGILLGVAFLDLLADWLPGRTWYPPGLVFLLAGAALFGYGLFTGEGDLGVGLWLGLGATLLAILLLGFGREWLPGQLGVGLGLVLLLGGATLFGYEAFSGEGGLGLGFGLGLGAILLAVLVLGFGADWDWLPEPAGLGLALVLLLGGAALFGSDLSADGGGQVLARNSFAYVDGGPCADCPVQLASAEVQDREGSTLFVFRGRWPTKAADFHTDLLMQAATEGDDFELVLHPASIGFEVSGSVSGRNIDPADVAVGLRADAFLLDLKDPLASQTPTHFLFGAWDGSKFTARIPEEGFLVWDGSGKPVLQPTSPQSPASPTVTVEPTTPEAFAAALGQAFRSGDDAFLLAHLDPAVIQRYGKATCRSSIAGDHDPTRNFEVLQATGPGVYDYMTDGLSTKVPNVLTVTANVTIRGQTTRIPVHFGAAGDELTWFKDCGTPLAS